MEFRDSEHISLPLALLFLSAIPSSPHLQRKNNLDSEKTLKIQPPGQTPAGRTCQSKLSQHNPLKDDFLSADDISDRTITHLSPGCAKITNKTCESILDMVVVTIDPCRDETNEH